MVQDIATRAERKIGGTGDIAGIKKHSYTKKTLDKYQKRYGDRKLETEQNWRNGEILDKKDSTKSSVRLDVVDEANDIVYDYKFVKKPMGEIPQQVKNIQQHGPQDATIKMVNPKKPI